MSSTNAPIVIGSSPSSGSTLLRVILGRLSGVLSGGELHVIDRPELFDEPADAIHANIETWMDVGYPWPYVAGAPTVFTRHASFGISREEVVALARQSATWGEVIDRFFALGIERAGCTRWLEKSPGNVFGFHRLRELHPECFFIHIVRDGRDVAASLMRRGAHPFWAISRWMASVLAGQRLAGDGSSVEIRYEALVRDPERELQRVCDLIGASYLPEIVRGEPQAKPSINAWKSAERGEISSTSVGTHRDLPPRRLDDLLAYFAEVRLSNWGHRQMAAMPGGPQRDVSALELLIELGYLDAAPEVRPLTHQERRGAWKHARYMRTQRAELLGIDHCPVATQLVPQHAPNGDA